MSPTPSTRHKQSVAMFCSQFLLQYTIRKKVYLQAVNTAVDYKLVLKCLIFGLFYFRPSACFDLSRSSTGDFNELCMLLILMNYVCCYGIIK
jgi:hypothetical protein